MRRHAAPVSAARRPGARLQSPQAAGDRRDRAHAARVRSPCSPGWARPHSLRGPGGTSARRAAAGHARIAAELLDDALALWRGPPLSEFAFDEFGQTTIAWLAELRLAALAARAEAGLHLGRHEVLVPDLTALTAEHPYDERLHGLLMLALYGAGRQSDALAVYQSVRSRLKDDLGLDPSPSLRDTERRILTQDASLAVEQTRLRTVIVAPASLDQLEDLAALAEPLARAVSRTS